MTHKQPKVRSFYLKKDDIVSICGLIAPDEEFRKVEKESGIWISNYARVLSKRHKKPRLLKTAFQKGYYRLTLNGGMYNKRTKHMYYVHVLVAHAFCVPGAWICPTDKIEIHHIKPIDREHDFPQLQYATNLMYVPRKLHKAIDSVAEIAVEDGKRWRTLDFIQAAEYYDLSPYDFLLSFANEKKQQPTKKRKQYQYYRREITTTDGRITPIHVRIIRTRDK